MTKKIIYIVFSAVLMCSATISFAQTKLSAKDMIAITPVVCDALDIPTDAKKVLNSKLTQIVTSNGLGSTSSRYTLTSNVITIDKQVTTTAPSMVVVKLEVSLYVVDICENIIIGETSITTKGVDSSEGRAYRSAINSLQASNPNIKSFMSKCRSSIVDYYATITPKLIIKADALSSMGKHDEAIAILADIPESIDGYADVAKKMVSIYRKSVSDDKRAEVKKLAESRDKVDSIDSSAVKQEEQALVNEAREARLYADNDSKFSLSEFTKSVNEWYLKTLSQLA